MKKYVKSGSYNAIAIRNKDTDDIVSIISEDAEVEELANIVRLYDPQTHKTLAFYDKSECYHTYA